MPDSLNQNTIVVASRKQISSDLKGETAILSLDKGVYYGLSDVGTSVWKLLQTPVSIAEIHSALSKEYDVEESILKEDIFNLLKRLNAEGLVEFTSNR